MRNTRGRYRTRVCGKRMAVVGEGGDFGYLHADARVQEADNPSGADGGYRLSNSDALS